MYDNHEFLPLPLAAETDLRAFVRSVLRDSAAVDDVFQETAMVLWERFAEFDRARPFGAWARGVATKKLLQRRDQDSRFPRTLSPEAIQRVSEAFDRLESPPELRRQDALQECFARLPEKSRELIRSRYRDERRPQQIAEETGRTIVAVYHLLSRVRSLLEDCIRERLKAWDGGGP